MGVTLICFSDRPFGIDALQAVAQAQIIPDNTLGEENSQVTPEQNINGLPAELIEGGARRGENLFHSFSEFNIEVEEGVYFANLEGIANIFSRVTGNDASNIMGTLGVRGNADLFFLNPNGIIFGENASLDVNGSFLATTADGIQFGDRGEFAADDPNAPSLLTVAPSAFFFSRVNSRAIESSSIAPAGLGIYKNPLNGLRVPDGEGLLFLGGEINIDDGGLHSRDGRIELVAVSGEATIGLNTDPANLSFDLPTQLPLTNIVLRNKADINTSGEGRGDAFLDQLNTTSVSIRSANLIIDQGFINSDVIGSGVGGDIAIETNQMLVQRGLITNITIGRDGGNISIKTNNLELRNTSRINTTTFTAADGGDIAIATDRLLLTDGGDILSETFGAGNAGNLSIDAREIEISGSSSGGRISGLFASLADTGNGGELTINTETLTIKDGAVISTGNFSSIGPNTVFMRRRIGQGNAGNITIEADSIQLENGGLLTAETFSGLGGNISLQVENTLSLQGNSSISAKADGVDNGGNIAIDTGFLIAFPPSDANGSDIVANAVQGQGGRIDIFTQGIFGIQARENLTRFNDITASSEFGLSGIVEINTFKIDPSPTSLDIPVATAETEVARTCKSDDFGNQSNFNVRGRGGLPESPKDLLETDTGLEDWRENESLETSPNPPSRIQPDSTTESEPKQVVEAQGWIINDLGRVMLVADSQNSSANIAPTGQNCQLN